MNTNKKTQAKYYLTRKYYPHGETWTISKCVEDSIIWEYSGSEGYRIARSLIERGFKLETEHKF